MRLHQTGALLTGARSELVPRAGVLVDGARIVAAGPLGSLAAEHATPLVTAARPLTPTGGRCWFMGGECDSPDDLRRVVRLHHKMGADFVKVMSTGGFAGPDRKYGSDFDASVVENIAAGIFVCPTVNVHALTMRERFGDALEKVIMGLYSGGAQIIAGTDAGIDNCPHDAYVSGLEALAMVGLPAVEILDAATLRAARALGVDDRTGTIEAGKDADLIAVRGDPRADVSVLRHVELAVARGAEHGPAPRRVLAAPSGPGPR